MAEESTNLQQTPETVIPDGVHLRSSTGKLIASKREATKPSDPCRASTGALLKGGMKNSTVKPSSPNSEGTIVPHYLRASTGSCHDFCKYGRKHETEVKPWRIVAKKVVKSNLNNDSEESGVVIEKKIKKPANSNPSAASKSISPNASSVVVNKTSFPSSKISVPIKPVPSKGKNILVNDKKKQNLVKREISAVNSIRESETNTRKGTSKELMKKSVSTPVGALISKPFSSRALSSKVNANRSKKLVSSLKDQNKISKAEVKLKGTDMVKDKHVIKVEAKKTNPEEVKKNQEGIEKVENKFADSEKVTDTIFPIPEVETEKIFSEVSNQDESNFDFLSSQSVSSTESSSALKSPALSLTKEEAQDELEYADILVNESDVVLKLETEIAVTELIQNDSNFVAPPSQSFSSSNISSPVKSSALSFDEEEVQDELEYTDSGSDDFDEYNPECNEISNLDEEGADFENHNSESRKVKSISEENDHTPTKLSFKRGKVIEAQANENGPRRLKFRRGKGFDENQGNDPNSRKRSYKKKGIVDDTDDTNGGSEKVVLRHQQVEGKKDSQGLFNNVIEETAIKLAETRKSKVKALVGAFETVISLQESKPSAQTSVDEK